MRINKIAYRLMGAICAFATVACVDDSFDVNNVSTEVTIGNGTTTLPLGYLDNKTIADLLGPDKLEEFMDDEGNLTFNFSGEGDSIDIEGITTEFEIPEIRNSFNVEYPEFAFDMETIKIEASEDVTVDLGVLDDYQIPDIDIPGFEIPDNVELPMIAGSYTKSFSEADLEGMHIDVELPEQIDNVDKIIFKDLEGNHHGAPMHLRVDFNDLADINGGGKLDFDLTIKGGTFTILDAQNAKVCDGDHYTEQYIIEDGADYIDFAIYIESLTNTTELDENHHLNIPLELTFDMDFELQTKAGNFQVNDMPHIELDAEFAYGDAEVEVSTDNNLVEYHPEEAQPIDIEGLPEQIKSVNRVSLKEGGILRLFSHGLSWLGEDLTDNMDVVMLLPDYLELHNLDGMNCEYNADTKELRASVAELDKGIQVGIKALDFGAAGIEPDENGNIHLDFAPDIVASFVENSEILVSQLQHEGDIEISLGIEKAMLSIESVSGRVDYSYTVSEEFALEGLSDLNLEIGGLGLKPIIEVTVTNPLTMPAELNGVITPLSGGVKVQENAATFDKVPIAAATYVDGEIVPMEIKLVIADESFRADYADAKYTFVPCDVTTLFHGKLPESLNIDLTLGVDPQKVQTIYMADALSVKYDYKVDIPFKLDNTLQIKYEDEMYGLNSTFKGLADYDIKVGDVTVIATITNTTPLQLSPRVTMLDKDGKATKAQVIIAEGTKIIGSSDGVTPAESVVRLTLNLGEDGRVSNIAAVDGIRMVLEATSAASDMAVQITNQQYIGVKLQLELAGGITVNIGDFM